MAREVKCPSGAILTINEAPFHDAKNLYQALLRELQHVKIDSNRDLMNLAKELVCIGFSSPAIEGLIWKCFEKCLYNMGTGPMKITKETFGPKECWQDYTTVCVEVAQENVAPFAKSLFAESVRLSQELITNLA